MSYEHYPLCGVRIWCQGNLNGVKWNFMLEEAHMLGHDPTSENEMVLCLYKGFGDVVPSRKWLLCEEAWHNLSWRGVLRMEAFTLQTVWHIKWLLFFLKEWLQQPSMFGSFIEMGNLIYKGKKSNMKFCFWASGNHDSAFHTISAFQLLKREQRTHHLFLNQKLKFR